MLRHEFQPGRLIAGVALLGAGVLYALDGPLGWSVPWFVVGPVVVGGLCLAAVASGAVAAVRHARAKRAAVPGTTGKDT
ncbi:hypothetical protein ACIQNU_37325 [Streptomyces sp. NPDC091292]|uniref:hypothetical protein n=1 Tax=Streptomyces sp. NPDC091292 TaxID=3365991 RepID=UPI00380D8A76